MYNNNGIRTQLAFNFMVFQRGLVLVKWNVGNLPRTQTRYADQKIRSVKEQAERL